MISRLRYILVLSVLFPLQYSQAETDIHIYQNATSFINEHKKLSLKQGENEIVFDNLSTSILPETLFLMPETINVSVLSQIYRPRDLSVSALLERNIGKLVRFFIKGSNSEIVGKYLGQEGGYLIEDNGTLKILNNVEQIHFPKLEPNMRLDNKFIAKLNCKDSCGETAAKFNYQASGINWHTQYLIELKDTLSFYSYVFIQNNSDIDFVNSNVTLVAGEPRRHENPPHMLRGMKAAMMDTAESSAANNFSESTSNDLYFYKLNRKIDIAKSSSGSYELFPVKHEVKYSRKYQYDSSKNNKVESIILIEKAEAKKLDLTLPRGVVKIYGSAVEGAKDGYILLAENHINDTPKGSELSLNIGNVFDVKVERKMINSTQSDKDKFREEEWELTFSNKKEKPISLDIFEHFNNYGTWQILDINAKYEKITSSSIKLTITLPFDRDEKIRYKVRYSY